MWKCRICLTEFEPVKPWAICCKPCENRALTLPGQALTVGERLWGKCYNVGGCWEYNGVSKDGRAAKIMVDRRQRPAAHVALMLTGRPRPSDSHVARQTCSNRRCVHPDHLEWIEWVGGTPLWAAGLPEEKASELLEHHRQSRAKNQRDYRERLKKLGARTMSEVAERELAADERRAAPPEPRPQPIEPQPVPEPVTKAPEPVEAAPEPAPRAAVNLASLLAGARIAPPD